MGQKKITLPIIIIAVVVLGAFLFYMGKTFLSGPKSYSSKEAGLPSFIDPKTNRPYQNAGGNSSSPPQTSSPGMGGGPNSSSPPGAMQGGSSAPAGR